MMVGLKSFSQEVLILSDNIVIKNNGYTGGTEPQAVFSYEKVHPVDGNAVHKRPVMSCTHTPKKSLTFERRQTRQSWREAR